MPKACQEALTAFRTGNKLDKDQFIKLVLSFGVHEYPRVFYVNKLEFASRDYEEAAKLKDAVMTENASGKVSYWRRQLDAWDHWASMCVAYGVEVRPHHA